MYEQLSVAPTMHIDVLVCWVDGFSYHYVCHECGYKWLCLLLGVISY